MDTNQESGVLTSAECLWFSQWFSYRHLTGGKDSVDTVYTDTVQSSVDTVQSSGSLKFDIDKSEFDSTSSIHSTFTPVLVSSFRTQEMIQESIKKTSKGITMLDSEGITVYKLSVDSQKGPC